MGLILRNECGILLLTTSLLAAGNNPPSIVQQPASYTVAAGTNVEFSVSASGDPPLEFEWRLNDKIIPNETQPVLNIAHVTLASAGNYTIAVSNAFGSVTGFAHLTVIGPIRPAQIRAVPGARIAPFFVPTAGHSVNFFWSKDGNDLDVEGDTLTFPNFSEADAGRYRVIAGDEFGLVELPAADLVASEPGPFDSWHLRTTLPPGDWVKLEQENNLYIALGYKQIATSTDALTWSPQTITSSGVSYLYDVTFGNGTYVAVGEIAGVFTSSTGEVWNRQPFDAFGQVRAVAYGNQTFVAVAQQSVFRSTDANYWVNYTPAPIDGSDVVWGNGVFVVASINLGGLHSSTNGMRWTRGDNLTNADPYLYRVAYGNGRFVAVGSDGYALVSTDGFKWTKQETGTIEWFSGLTFANGYFVGITRGSSIVSSKDGIEWTVHSRGPTPWIDPFNYLPLICAGDSSVIIGVQGNQLFESDVIVNCQMTPGPQLSINTRIGTDWTIEATSDPGAAWQPVDRITVKEKPFRWNDSDPGLPMRFYRIVP